MRRGKTRTLYAKDLMRLATIIAVCTLLGALLALMYGLVAGETPPCNSLAELECIKSPVCTLIQVRFNKYQCRSAVGKCESGFIQWWGNKNDLKESCVSKAGCMYV